MLKVKCKWVNFPNVSAVAGCIDGLIKTFPTLWKVSSPQPCLPKRLWRSHADGHFLSPCGANGFPPQSLHPRQLFSGGAFGRPPPMTRPLNKDAIWSRSALIWRHQARVNKRFALEAGRAEWTAICWGLSGCKQHQIISQSSSALLVLLCSSVYGHLALFVSVTHFPLIFFIY